MRTWRIVLLFRVFAGCAPADEGVGESSEALGDSLAPLAMSAPLE